MKLITLKIMEGTPKSKTKRKNHSQQMASFSKTMANLLIAPQEVHGSA